eukprot:GFUD01013592.1.p1 GENE.GFUD01013592.1~~GFUD01013592.1.p1  ORF type:complete len:127 (-),score=26.47 GFUD01013592.1:56-436(-)
MASVPLRTEVIRLYSRILKVGRKWQAQDINETKVERDYILEEAKLLFRKNKNLTELSEIRQRLVEAEARVTMAEHYGNPYPRPVNLPKTSFTKREGKKVGKAIQKMNEMSRPVYIRSSDDAMQKDN